jgi:DNA repair protein RecO (recombination protein O)
VVLRCTDYSETSQVAAMATPDLGQIHVLAKGSRRPRKDARGPLDLLNYGDVVVARRPAGQLHILTDWNLRDSFVQLRRDLNRVWSACYAVEVVLTATTENPDDGPVCASLLTFLQRLDRGDTAELAIVRFLARALQAHGSAPVTENCVQCRGTLRASCRFSASLGGALCGDCDASDPSAFAISRGSLIVMGRLSQPDERSAPLRISDEQAREIRRAFNEQIQYHLGRPLKTARFLASV